MVSRDPATKPAATPNAATRDAPTPAAPTPDAPTPGALQTAVEATVELTEIGLRLGAQALRTALSRLPRP